METLKLERFTLVPSLLVARAQSIADDSLHAETTAAHLSAAVLELPGAVAALHGAGLDVDACSLLCKATLAKTRTSQAVLGTVSTGLLMVLRRAEKDAGTDGKVGPAQLLGALAKLGNDPLGEALSAAPAAREALVVWLETIDMPLAEAIEAFPKGVRAVFVLAQRPIGHAEVTPLHVLQVVLGLAPIVATIRERGHDPQQIAASITAALDKLPRSTTKTPPVSLGLLALLRRVRDNAGAGAEVEFLHLMRALKDEKGAVYAEALAWTSVPPPETS